MAAKAIVHRIEDDNFAGETKTQRMQEGNLELISPQSVGGVPCNPVSLNTADSFCCPFRRKRFPARPPLEPCSFFSSFLFFFSFPCLSHSCRTLSLPSLHFFPSLRPPLGAIGGYCISKVWKFVMMNHIHGNLSPAWPSSPGSHGKDRLL